MNTGASMSLLSPCVLPGAWRLAAGEQTPGDLPCYLERLHRPQCVLLFPISRAPNSRAPWESRQRPLCTVCPSFVFMINFILNYVCTRVRGAQKHTEEGVGFFAAGVTGGCGLPGCRRSKPRSLPTLFFRIPGWCL